MKSVTRNPHDITNPIFFRLLTPSVRALSDHLQLWIESGITGGIVVGEARIGKSTALQLIKERIEDQSLTNISTILTSVPYNKSKGIRSLYQEILKDLNPSASVRGTESELKFDIIHACTDRIAQFDYNMDIVFLIDEAQNASTQQLSGLAMLQDAFVKLGIAAYFFLIANKSQIKPLYKAISHHPGSHDHLMGRFFLQAYEFKTIQTIKDLRAVLKLFDKTKYMGDEKSTITTHYLPEAKKLNWKLENISGLLWEGFINLKPAGVLHWKMKYLIGTLAPLLVDYLPQYGIKSLDDEMIRECVYASSIIPSETFLDLIE